MKIQRESGYYWVFINDDWEIARYFEEFKMFKLISDTKTYYEEDFSYIGTTNIVNPNK